MNIAESEWERTGIKSLLSATAGVEREVNGGAQLAIAAGELFRAHSFELACAENDIDHRLTKPRHPWTNGQVERMNRTIKGASVKRYHYDNHDQLRQHLTDFVAAYNFGRRLKTLKGLTPYEAICKAWLKEPHRFMSNPTHQIPGPNI